MTKENQLKEPQKILITLDRDIMWEYFQHYKRIKPRCRTFPFASKLRYKLLDKNGEPQRTKGGNIKYKARSRKLSEIEKENLTYKPLSLNELLPIDSMAYKTLKERWGDLGKWLATENDLDEKLFSNSIVELSIFNEGRANTDADNFGAVKTLNDGLFVQSNMFIDDNYKHINPFLICVNMDKEHPRTEIKITVLDDSIIDTYEKMKIHLELWKENKEIK